MKHLSFLLLSLLWVLSGACSHPMTYRMSEYYPVTSGFSYRLMFDQSPFPDQSSILSRSFTEVEPGVFKMAGHSGCFSFNDYCLVTENGIYEADSLEALRDDSDHLFLPATAKLGQSWSVFSESKPASAVLSARLTELCGREGDYLVVRFDFPQLTAIMYFSKGEGPVLIENRIRSGDSEQRSIGISEAFLKKAVRGE